MKNPKSKKRLAAVLLISMAWFALITPSFNGAAASEPREEAASDYVIGPEDVLEISVWKNADLSKTLTVRPDGKISLPLIGDIQASGLTPEELRDNIVNRLNEYQETAIASVIVLSVNSYRIFILGEVKIPGTYLLKARTTILQAISLAGGTTAIAAPDRTKVIRSTDGKDTILTVEMSAITKRGEKQKDISLQPNDVVYVPQSFF
jgi:polysaccharide export outer membrane protein